MSDDDDDLRQATQADLTEILILARALAREDGGQRDPFVNAAWVETAGAARFSEVIDDATAACYVVAMRGEIVGFISGRMLPTDVFSLVPEARIGSVFVEPNGRGHGLGERLIGAFVDWAKANGAIRVSVSAYASNAGAIRFYERVGFSPLTVTMQLVLPTA